MSQGSPVFRNALILVGAQLAGTPLSILVNAMMGRYLGAEAFGYIFLASTLTRLGFLFVEWGHNGVLPAGIARDRSVAGELLGTSLAWRLCVAILVCSLLAGGSWLYGYGAEFQIVLALVSLQSLVGTLMAACQDATRGYERTDIAAAGQLGQQILVAIIVIPTLMLGGRLNATLVGQLAALLFVAALVGIATRRVGVGSLSVSRDAFSELFKKGSYFLSFGVAMALQATVDVILLEKFASAEVVGWQAAAQRLAGVLLIPATALVSALYPTLSRLYAEDRAGYADTLRRALRGTVVLAVPAAVGCGLYREVGIQLFSKKEFGPAHQNLIVFAFLLPLVYVSMPIGTALLAAGKQRAWAALQLICVAVSLGLDPFLIPWFQRRFQNGGVGVCVAGVISEVFMVGVGLSMTEKGVINRSFAAAAAKAILAGAVMIGAGLGMQRLSPFVAAPISLTLYFAFLWVIRGISQEELAIVRNAVARRFRK